MMLCDLYMSPGPAHKHIQQCSEKKLLNLLAAALGSLHMSACFFYLKNQNACWKWTTLCYQKAIFQES